MKDRFKEISKDAFNTYIKARNIIGKLKIKGVSVKDKLELISLFADINLQVYDICIELTKLNKRIIKNER